MGETRRLVRGRSFTTTDSPMGRLREARMSDFTGKTALITGVTGNLGGAVARAFLAAGANAVLPDRGQGRVAKALGQAWDPAHALAVEGVDATDPDAAERSVRSGLERFGHLDILVNTVGGYRGGTSFAEMSLEDWEFLMNLNAKSMLVTTRAVVPAMQNQGSGKIVSVAARAGLSGAAKLGVYSASKAAVIRITEALSSELKDLGINVNCVLPGTLDTPENREMMPKADPGRWVSPEAITDVILFLASESSRAIHGAAIPVYGRS
jgi:NAD(P)-dependent dehydrogenase (short-subunit alcohol dehydrogenase family)